MASQETGEPEATAGQGPEAAEPGVTDAAEPAGAAPEPTAAAPDRAEEYRQSLLRLRADFDNFRRRTASDQARWAETAVASFVAGLLPVVDNLERALGAAGAEAAALRQGVELTLRQLTEHLAAAGIVPMVAVGQPFDPARHEAVARGPVAGVAEGCVAEEYRRGYLLRDAVLRPALVKVAVADAPPEEASGAKPAAEAPDAAAAGAGEA